MHERIFNSISLPPDGAFHELLNRAISSKEAKRANGKENTVVLIDNRTSVQHVREVTNAVDLLAERLSRSPFKEIWFYNGYCSDLDGNNGDYTIIPVKITPES